MPGGPDGKIAARETRDSFRVLSLFGAEAKVDSAPRRSFATMLASMTSWPSQAQHAVPLRVDNKRAEGRSPFAFLPYPKIGGSKRIEGKQEGLGRPLLPWHLRV